MDILLGILFIIAVIGAALLLTGGINKVLAKHIPQEYIPQEGVERDNTTIPTHLLPDPDKLEKLATWFDLKDWQDYNSTGDQKATEVQDDLRKWARALRYYTGN